jgi:hypothetical protein
MDDPIAPARQPGALSWAGWTFCRSGQLPAPGTRCYLRVRVSADLVEEVWAAYDPVGWLTRRGARIGADRALAWRLAE